MKSPLYGKRIVTTSFDKTARIWHPTSEAQLAELYRKEGIILNLYYRWSEEEFLEAGK